MKKKVIIFGAGISGLSASHYLNKLGYDVLVIESLDMAGGLARSERVKTDNGMPSEYSWRGFGPWYHNTFDLMKTIPIYKNKRVTNVYEEELSNPINFILTPDELQKYDKETNNFDNKYRISIRDMVSLIYIGLKTTLASTDRSQHEYALENAKKYLEYSLTKEGVATISSLFGPWVGTDNTRASLHHVSLFFRRNLLPGPPSPYFHLNTDRPFVQESMSRWLILKRPSNESWFDPWVKYLKISGVKFNFGTKLDKLEWDANKKMILYADIENNKDKKRIKADYYVLAINPYITKNILDKTPSLLQDSQLKLFTPLTKDSPHKQISFRIAFSEKINLPDQETGIILIDSEFNITFFSQDQLWHKDTYLGKNVKSLWSGTATIDSIPGKLYGLEMKYLTKNEFIEEIKYQMNRSKSFNELIMMSNNGRNLNSFRIERIEVWHSWVFPKESSDKHNRNEIIDAYPKWVNNSVNYPYQPKSQTSINNLYLAGAHTQTFADLYSMEAAVESGRRVSDLITNTQTILPQYMPIIISSFRMIDTLLYSLGLPNIVDVFSIIIIIIFIWLIFKKLR